MKKPKLWLTIREGENAYVAKTILATCDRKVIERTAAELNARLTGSSEPPSKSRKTAEKCDNFEEESRAG